MTTSQQLRILANVLRIGKTTPSLGRNVRGAIVSPTECKSNLALLYKVDRRTAKAVADAGIQLCTPLKAMSHTITSDNGKEFADHMRISESLHAELCFAHLFSSWEQAINEDTNGLIRQDFSKKRDSSAITVDEILKAMRRLNN